MPLAEKVEEWLGNELKGISEKFTVSIDKNAKLISENIASNNHGKYGLVALNAANKLNNLQDIEPGYAWDEAASFVFPTQLSSRKKG